MRTCFPPARPRPRGPTRRVGPRRLPRAALCALLLAAGSPLYAQESPAPAPAPVGTAPGAAETGADVTLGWRFEPGQVLVYRRRERVISQPWPPAEDVAPPPSAAAPDRTDGPAAGATPAAGEASLPEAPETTAAPPEAGAADAPGAPAPGEPGARRERQGGERRGGNGPGGLRGMMEGMGDFGAPGPEARQERTETAEYEFHVVAVTARGDAHLRVTPRSLVTERREGDGTVTVTDYGAQRARREARRAELERRLAAGESIDDLPFPGESEEEAAERAARERAEWEAADEAERARLEARRERRRRRLQEGGGEGDSPWGEAGLGVLGGSSADAPLIGRTYSLFVTAKGQVARVEGVDGIARAIEQRLTQMMEGMIGSEGSRAEAAPPALAESPAPDALAPDAVPPTAAPENPSAAPFASEGAPPPAASPAPPGAAGPPDDAPTPETPAPDAPPPAGDGMQRMLSGLMKSVVGQGVRANFGDRAREQHDRQLFEVLPRTPVAPGEGWRRIYVDKLFFLSGYYLVDSYRVARWDEHAAELVLTRELDRARRQDAPSLGEIGLLSLVPMAPRFAVQPSQGIGRARFDRRRGVVEELVCCDSLLFEVTPPGGEAPIPAVRTRRVAWELLGIEQRPVPPEFRPPPDAPESGDREF